MWPIAPAEKGHASRSSVARLACAALVAAAATVALWPAAASAQTPARPAVDVRAAAAPAMPPSARERTARRQLRRHAELAVDPRTGTVRSVQGRDGPLTDVAAGDRTAVALGWIRDRSAALGLTAEDVDALELAERSVTPGTRITHLRYEQADRGIPAFDGGLRVSLDRGGRILSVTGSPQTGLEAASVVPRLDAVAALAALQRDVGAVRAVDVVAGPAGTRRATRFAGGDLARLVLFGRRLAWHVTYRATSLAHYDAVVDATSGAILFRQNLVAHDSDALVYPSHPAHGAAITVDLQPRWISAAALDLDGPYAHVYSDLNGNDLASDPEEIPRNGDGDFRYPVMEFDDCSPVICTWDRGTSWQVNRRQNGVQAFYLVNRFRDHLATAPIGFAEFSGADAVQVETNDPASLNNASMSTPPSGAPRMQLGRFGGDFRNVNAGDSAAIVWHEYTHGLSSRLVAYGDGSSALSSAQSGAMGEGWSDWYALDLLVSLGGSTDVGYYTDATPHTLRTMPIDCPAGAVKAGCPGAGYTYGDFGEVAGGPAVHDDGEIWAQTLWDLRTAVGSSKARALITDGMRMSPPEPSFLDMRNAILAAEAGLPGDDRATVWEVFRRRGMGSRAYTESAADADPVEDFSAPPPAGAATGRTAGTVTSADTGLPLGNVSVSFSGLGPAAATGANGAYALDAPAGRYPELAFSAGGYERAAVAGFDVAAGASRVQDVALRRNWTASAGGAVVTAVSDNSGGAFGCGYARLIDQRPDTVWSAWNPAVKPGFSTPTIVVRLPVAIDVAGFGLDPTHGCGNPPGASTAGYRVEVSSDGAAFTTAAEGTLTGRTFVPAAAQGVRYVRLKLLSPQSGASEFIDFSELEVFGGPPNRLPTGTLAASRLRLGAGGTVDFAASFTDPDSKITGYDWDFDGNGTVDRSTPGPSTSFAYRSAGAFDATVAARDFRGGAGVAGRAITVTRAPRRPRIAIPKRGSKGRLAFRVTCDARCRVVGTLRVGRRVLRRTRRTITVTAQRRVAVTLPRKVRRAARRRDARTVRAVLTVTARDDAGRRTTEKRTVRIRV